MKIKLIITGVCITLISGGYVFANEGHKHKMADGTMMKDADMPKGQTSEATSTKAVEVGNKICPVSGDRISPPSEKGEMGEAIKYEYNGKIYNLCCPMCIKDFKKNPKKYSKIADEETKEIQVDPHRDHNHNNS